jgi:tetratricopeptide (TPR) repeat protein
MTLIDDVLEAGCLAMDDGRWGDAERAFRQVLALEERQPALTLLGAVQNHLGDARGAVDTLRRSLELKPDDDEAHYHIALALRRSDPAAALWHLQRAASVDPAPPNYHRELALTLWKLERFDDALLAAERALDGNRADEWAHNVLGLIHESRGDLAAAKQAHLAAAAIAPDCGLFWASAARIAARESREEEAERLFRQALATEIDSGVVCRYYGQYLQHRGRLSTARRYLQRAVDLDPDDERSRRALASLDGY